MPVSAVEQRNQGLACGRRLNRVIDHDLAGANGFVTSFVVTECAEIYTEAPIFAALLQNIHLTGAALCGECDG